jgi:hypothetical protein
LLRLSGEERSRTILANLTELLKGDASGAAAVLGATESTIPEDTQWAQAAVDALDNGAEAEIQKALDIQNSLIELDALFPGRAEGLVTSDDQTTISQTLASESFFEHLPSLRSALRSVRDRAQARCAQESERYLQDLADARATLESQPEWARLLDEDREDIASRLRPATVLVESENPVRSVRTLLVRRSSVPGLLRELQGEVERRKPGEPEPTAAEPGESEAPVEEIQASTLVPASVIRGPRDLETWLAALRERIANILRDKKHVRITSETRSVGVGDR